MEYVVAYRTDIGTVKDTNQDALASKVVETKHGKVGFGIVCDGMGGLSKGELASKEVIMAMCDWFDDEFVPMVNRGIFSEEVLINRWNQIVQEQNSKLGRFGKENNIMLGTTLSAILMYDGNYYIVHVGDSRIYELRDSVNQLTTDQTFIVREIAAGRMTVEQAKVDPRRSVLLQCVGASPVVNPEFIKGKIHKKTSYVLCSDGFRHQVTPEEIYDKLGPIDAYTEEKIEYGCIILTELDKERGETDNISVLVMHVE